MMHGVPRPRGWNQIHSCCVSRAVLEYVHQEERWHAVRSVSESPELAPLYLSLALKHCSVFGFDRLRHQRRPFRGVHSRDYSQPKSNRSSAFCHVVFSSGFPARLSACTLVCCSHLQSTHLDLCARYLCFIPNTFFVGESNLRLVMTEQFPEESWLCFSSPAARAKDVFSCFVWQSGPATQRQQ